MSGLSELFGKISGSLLPVLFISFAAPLLMMALICRGRSRKLLFFLLFGTTACLLSGYANSIIRSLSGLSSGFFNTNFAPAIEETLKALPIVILAFSKNHDKRTLLECSVAVGIGFAVLENAATLARNIEIISLPLALGRGFGSGMMHGLTTLASGFGLTLARKRRKLFYTGSFALLSVSVMYHSLYNILVSSDYQLAGFCLPLVTFVPLLIYLKKNRRGKE